eukprot:250735-Amphidinium_carterae.1
MDAIHRKLTRKAPAAQLAFELVWGKSVRDAQATVDFDALADLAHVLEEEILSPDLYDNVIERFTESLTNTITKITTKKRGYSRASAAATGSLLEKLGRE